MHARTHTGPLNPPHIPQQKHTWCHCSICLSLRSHSPHPPSSLSSPPPLLALVISFPPLFSHLSPRPPLRCLAFAAARNCCGRNVPAERWNARQNMSLDREARTTTKPTERVRPRGSLGKNMGAFWFDGGWADTG